ncbi:MAG: hypothetical protein ACM3OF_11670 [Gemmatimonas sp.]
MSVAKQSSAAVSLRISGHDQVSQRQRLRRTVIPALVIRLILETPARFAACAGAAFPNVLLAVLSWVIGEFLAGCAAYARGMYLVPVPTDDHVEAPGTCASAAAARGDALPATTARLRVIAGTAIATFERGRIETAIGRK